MKREFYERLYFYELHTKRPLEVFKASLCRIKSYELFAAVVRRLRPNELYDFLGLVESTTYDLERTNIIEILYKHTFTRAVYDRFSRLDIKEIPYNHPPVVGVYNYLHYKRVKNSCEMDLCWTQEMDCLDEAYYPAEGNQAYSIEGLDAMCQKAARDGDPHVDRSSKYLYKTVSSEEVREMRSVLSLICFHNRKDGDLREYVANVVKDSFLMAIMDSTQVIEAGNLGTDELLLLHPSQIANASSNALLFSALCRMNCADSACRYCGRLVAVPFDDPALSEEVLCIRLESALYEADMAVVWFVLGHAPHLCNEKVLKMLVRLYLSYKNDADNDKNANLNFKFNMRYTATAIGTEPRTEDIASLFSLFALTEESEQLLLRFLKQSAHSFYKMVLVIPHLMRSRILYFACFAAMHREFAATRNECVKMWIRSLVYQFRKEFRSILDMMLEYYYDQKVGDSLFDDCSVKDLGYLHGVFGLLAEMHSQKAAEFVKSNFFNIFLCVLSKQIGDPQGAGDAGRFTERFLADNRKYIEIKQIMDGGYQAQCNDTDVMVGLLFNGIFDLSIWFRPSPATFIRCNLSQLLFKIKAAYQDGTYQYVRGGADREDTLKCVCDPVYRILKYVLKDIQIPLYFGYIWPTIEYFLNKEMCACASDFVEWLRSEYYSPAMVPYMCVPFASVEDLPMTINIEKNLCETLTRFFRAQSGHLVPGRSDTGLLSSCGGERAAGLATASKTKWGVPSSHNDCVFFIVNFLYFFESSKIFRDKILSIYPRCDAPTKMLLGNLCSSNHRTSLSRAPADVFRSILENFLLRIDYNQQDLYSFVIQEFLKEIRDGLEPEVESMVNQFRYTKYELKGEKERLKKLGIDPEQNELILGASYLSFLRSLVWRLYLRTTGYSHLRFLVLFGPEVVEYAALCLIAVCHRTIPGFSLSDVTSAINDYYALDSTPNAAHSTVLRDIIGFMLKINIFIGRGLVTKQDYLTYAIAARDYYSIIYILDGAFENESERELLQLSYYMIGDMVRVRGFNTMSGAYSSPLGMFFELCIERNFRGARQCLDEYHGYPRAGGPYMPMLMNEILKMGGDERNGDAQLIRAIPHRVSAGIGGSYSHNSYEAVDYKWPNYVLHAYMDYQLMRETKDIRATMAIINGRWRVAENKEDILRMHTVVAELLDIQLFTRMVELESVRMLRKKRDYASCVRSIAKLILQGEWAALYELALVKIEQKQHGEAKELLRRLISLHAPGDELYNKSVVKLCEISRSDWAFTYYIEAIESHGGQISKSRGDEMASSGSVVSLCTPAGSDTSASGQCINNQLSEMRLREGSTGNSGRGRFSNLSYLKRLHFLAAKHFEKSNVLQSLEYYYKSLDSDYEAVPKFFHLLASASSKMYKRIGELIEQIIEYHLQTIIPYYNQISNKISIQTDAFRFYHRVMQVMLERAPYETFWSTLVLVNSRREDIRKRADEIVGGLSLGNRVIFKNIQKIAQEFIAISRAKSKPVRMEDFALRELLPAAVNVPGRRAMIAGVRDDIVVFTSLQSPKKIILLGDDGIEYPMIVKYRDDLRKDSRVMDLDRLLNKLFEHGYYIRSYDVIPFTHDAGIIEYVPGMCSLKEICVSLYDQVNEMAAKFASHKRIGGNNMAKILAHFPPIFHGWLKSRHSDPYVFYTRRENYIRTYAIMCVVGWFIGLGDRHAENTHFDLESGDTVHVDLNCIFDKGRTFDIPERVPFRLTQNIVDGCGSLGLAGTFRRTMCYTLRTMRAHKDAIIANLLSFVFDPLFEWARKKNEPARIIEMLSARLDFDDEDELADRLIDEATDVNNLGAMYIGWMAFL